MSDNLPIIHDSQSARQLKQSRQWCEQLCRGSKSSFVHSFSLLDRPRRQAMYALYAFARITDDLGDSAQAVELRSAQLSGWRGLLQSHGQDRPGVDRSLQRFSMLWPALADCVTRYQVPLHLLEDVVDGVAMDLDHAQPANWDELRHYCYHVASAVGLACAYIWRADERIPEQAAIDCGLAFQLTNILRDVAEDARMGRVYLPLSAFHAFNVDLQRWLSGKPNGRWRDLIEHSVVQARELYTSSWQTIDYLTPHSQRMFSLMWRSYRGLLEQVAVSKERLWSQDKIRLTNRKRISLITTHFIPPIFSRLPAP